VLQKIEKLFVDANKYVFTREFFAPLIIVTVQVLLLPAVIAAHNQICKAIYYFRLLVD